MTKHKFERFPRIPKLFPIFIYTFSPKIRVFVTYFYRRKAERFSQNFAAVHRFFPRNMHAVEDAFNQVVVLKLVK